MSDEKTLAFVAASIRSIWTLELLLLMRREAHRTWLPEELVREMRASNAIVQSGLASLAGAGLVAVGDDRRFQYKPASRQLDGLVESIHALYSAKPVAVINAIVARRDEMLRIFAESFRLKE